MLRFLFIFCALSLIVSTGDSLGFESKGQACTQCHKLNQDEASDLLKGMIPGLKVLAVSPAQAKGFWEVYIESGGRKGILYVDFTKKYFFSGNLVSIADKKSLTQERMTDLNRVDFSKIPLEDALVMGDPKAKIKIVAFDDPD